MKYILTDATGFVGDRVVRQLSDAGHQVIAMVRSPTRAGDLRALGISLCAGDVTEKESVRGADGVFHVAGWYKLGARDKTSDQKVNVLELMRELHIPRGIYTSTLAGESYFHGGP